MEPGVTIKQRESAAAHRVHVRTVAQLRAMSDTQRARWVQSMFPQHFDDCPACAGGGCMACVDTGRMSRIGVRAWLAAHQGTAELEGGRDEAPVWQ